MILIRGLSKTVLEKLLFHNFNITIHKGNRLGLVGPNGSGKSTLLNILAGVDYPDEGLVDTEKERIGFLEQQIPPDEIRQTVSEYLNKHKPHEIQSLFEKLKFLHPKDAIIANLSGGEKTKLAMIKVLLNRPNVLLLDEPTNHLDSETKKWLIDFLNAWHGIVIAVSHDRAFLNACANQILEFDPVRNLIHVHEGNYDAFIESRKLKNQKWQRDYEQQQKDLQKMKAFVKEKQRQSHMTTDPAIGKQIRQMEKRIQREITDQEITRPISISKIPKLNIQGYGHSGKLIVRLSGVEYSIDGKGLLKNFSCEIRGQDRIQLIGKNGSGKTTLAKLLLGKIQADTGEIRLGENIHMGYFDQEHMNLPKGEMLIDYARSLSHKGDDRAFLARYGFTESTVQKRMGALSQGEQARLIIAKLMLESYDFLILDEPTNHLDIESKEIIERAIAGYKGALLVISHDQYFVEQININKVWQLENGAIKQKVI